MALSINTLLLATSLDWDTIPVIGIKTGSKGSTRERAPQVLIEHQTLQKEWGRAFWPSVYWSLTLPVAFIPLWPSLPALDPAVVVSIATPSCQFCAMIPQACQSSWSCGASWASVTCSADSSQWNFASLAKSAGFVVVRCLQRASMSSVAMVAFVSSVERGRGGLRTPQPFGSCSAARRASFVQPLECQLHVALSKGSRCKDRELDELFIFHLRRHSLKILRMMVTRSKQTKRTEPSLNTESGNESLEQKSFLKNLSSYHASVFTSR